MDRWLWVFRYAVACCLALLLAGILGSSGLFQNARVGPNGVSASDVVRFFGYGAALLLLWLAARRAAQQLPDDRGSRSLLRRTLEPLATLVVLALAYPVPLFLLHPVLTETEMMAYRWCFVLAISAAAVWLVLAASREADALSAVFLRLRDEARRRPANRPASAQALTRSPGPTTCRHCGRDVPSDAPVCQHCGHALAA